MIFNSYAFLAFFPIVTLAYYLMPMRARRPWLLAASYYFYMCWNVQYALLIAASTLVTYLCALALGRMEAKAGRRAVLALGLAINLGILCFPHNTYRQLHSWLRKTISWSYEYLSFNQVLLHLQIGRAHV